MSVMSSLSLEVNHNHKCTYETTILYCEIINSCRLAAYLRCVSCVACINKLLLKCFFFKLTYFNIYIESLLVDILIANSNMLVKKKKKLILLFS